MTVTLAFLRHGETSWSRDKRVQGRTDIGLTEAARATLSASRLPPECLSMQVVSSPLIRCVQTATQLGLTPSIDSRLAEMAWGEWEGKRLPELRSELGDAMQQNEDRGWDFTPPGGESPRLVWHRVQPCLAQWAASGQSTLAIAHRGVIRTVFAQATGWNMLGKPPAKLDWSAVQLFTLDASGSPTVLRLNLPLSDASDRSASTGAADR